MTKQLTTLFSAIFLISTPLFARHILGGGMGYYHTVNGQLMVEMVVYRDCGSNGANFDIPAAIAVYKPSGALLLSLSINEYDFEKLEQDNFPCDNPAFCIEKGVYTFPLSLPEDDSSYIVVYQRCCRGNDVTNLINPQDIGLTMFVEISAEARLLKNNSPRWTGHPQFQTCAHQPNTLDLSAVEPDGDLLVYSFCNPLLGGGTIVTVPDVFSCAGSIPTPPCSAPYELVPFAVPNYTFNNPLGSVVSQLNATNGQWDIVPDFIGKFSYAICIQEYRNGQLISTTQQDLTTWVHDFVGTKDVPATPSITCYPNPSNNMVYISTESFNTLPIQIEISDFSGKVWLTAMRGSAGFHEQLDVAQLPAGLYMITVLAEGKRASSKFVRH